MNVTGLGQWSSQDWGFGGRCLVALIVPVVVHLNGCCLLIELPVQYVNTMLQKQNPQEPNRSSGTEIVEACDKTTFARASMTVLWVRKPGASVARDVWTQLTSVMESHEVNACCSTEPFPQGLSTS
jgi:hypothetical protein